MKTRIIKFIFIMVSFTFFLKNEIYAHKEEWKTVDAVLDIREYNKEVFKEGCLFNLLLKSDYKTLQDVLEEDGQTIKIFNIRYQARVMTQNNGIQNQEILQQGLLKSLDSSIRDKISNKEHSSTLKIIYKINDPVLIQFNHEGKNIAFPTLVTDTIDSQWVLKKI